LSVIALITLFLFKSIKSDNEVVNQDEKIVEYAFQYLTNKRLIKIGKALDCSGFTQMVYAHFKIYLPPSAKEQYLQSNCTDFDQMCPGDMIFFKTDKNYISHVGIYICDGKFVHSPGRRSFVRIDSISDPYWKNKLVCGGFLKSR